MSEQQKLHSVFLPLDILTTVGEALANDGCDSQFTMLAEMVTSSLDLITRLGKTRRPVVLDYVVTSDDLTVALPICSMSVCGAILVNWGDHSADYYAGHTPTQNGTTSCCSDVPNTNKPLSKLDEHVQHPHHMYITPGVYRVRVFRKNAASHIYDLRSCWCSHSDIWTLHSLNKFCLFGTVAKVGCRRDSDPIVEHRGILKQPRDLTEMERSIMETTIAILEIIKKYKEYWRKIAPTFTIIILIHANSVFASILDAIFYRENAGVYIGSILRDYDIEALIFSIAGVVSGHSMPPVAEIAALYYETQDDQKRVRHLIETLLKVSPLIS